MSKIYLAILNLNDKAPTYQLIKMKLSINSKYTANESEINHYITHFETEGDLFVKGSRNTIKIYNSSIGQLNIKSFKKPNFINTIVYKYFRDSKAKRSFDFAMKLISKNIGTPEPIAFAEYSNAFSFGKSFYVCKHINAEYTYRDLVENPNLPDHEAILRAFTDFCFKLHEAGVEFKDHSPGNTLINKNDQGLYDFYLVDLNRMTFHDYMTFEQRMFNLRRLTPKKEMIRIMANEYSKLYSYKTEYEIFSLMWKNTETFQEKFHSKQKLKRKLKFWKKHK